MEGGVFPVKFYWFLTRGDLGSFVPALQNFELLDPDQKFNPHYGLQGRIQGGGVLLSTAPHL